MSRVLRAALIVLLGTSLGLAWNTWSGRGFDLRANALLRAQDEVVSPKGAKVRLERGALFLDARPLPFYDMGHIPSALSLPEDDFDRAFGRLEPTLRSSLDIVVYCSGYGCDASHIVAHKLRDHGIQAAILVEGWPGWTEAGYPTQAGHAP